jgi:hypothetical protein
MVFLSLGVSSFKVCLVAHLSGEFAEPDGRGDGPPVTTDAIGQSAAGHVRAEQLFDASSAHSPLANPESGPRK